MVAIPDSYPPKADASVGLDFVGWGWHGWGLACDLVGLLSLGWLGPRVGPIVTI